MIKCWLSVSEGCADLVSCFEEVRMTADGVVVIEEAGPADTVVSLWSVDCEKLFSLIRV